MDNFIIEIAWSCGVVVITSALHAEGPQFDPGRDHKMFFVFGRMNSNLFYYIFSYLYICLGYR